VPMGHTSGALAPRNSAGCVRRRQDAIFLFTFDRKWSDPTPVGCMCRETSGETHLISTEVQQDLPYE
jgi:hypothetical protein